MAFHQSGDFFRFAGPQETPGARQPDFFSFTRAQDPSGAPQPDFLSFTKPKDRPQAPFTPAFDFLETTHEYILEGEFPGLHDKKQTVIEFTDAQTISIRGKIERREESERIVKGKGEWGDKAWVTERKVGEFRREVTFPGSIDVEAARATLEYGVLRIVVPKIVSLGGDPK